MDGTAWGALAAALTVLGGVYTWWAFRHRGTAAGTRGVALTLLPAAAWLTGTLRMFTRIVDAVADWATSLVFSPFVWLGTILFGLSILLWVVGGVLHGRNAKRAGDPALDTERRAPLNQPRTTTQQPIDPELAEIEALLKNRGID